jgi:hypothetical protein
MREFKIYLEIEKNASEEFKKFAYEIEKRINADEEIIESAKQTNRDFVKALRKVTADSENDLYIATIIKSLRNKVNRYLVVKNLEFDDKKYEAQVDLLERKFTLQEIEF